MNYVITTLSGKQYKISIGDTVTIDGNHGTKGENLSIGQVLAKRDESFLIGTPYLSLKPIFKVIDHSKSQKIRVATYKSKSRYRKVKGHRQGRTILELIKLETKGLSNKVNSDKNSTPKKPKQTTNSNTPVKTSLKPKPNSKPKKST